MTGTGNSSGHHPSRCDARLTERLASARRALKSEITRTRTMQSRARFLSLPSLASMGSCGIL